MQCTFLLATTTESLRSEDAELPGDTDILVIDDLGIIHTHQCTQMLVDIEERKKIGCLAEDALTFAVEQRLECLELRLRLLLFQRDAFNWAIIRPGEAGVTSLSSYVKRCERSSFRSSSPSPRSVLRTCQVWPGASGP